MVIIKTKAVAVNIQAVSPVSIFGAAAAAAGAAAAAAVAAAAVAAAASEAASASAWVTLASIRAPAPRSGGTIRLFIKLSIFIVLPFVLFRLLIGFGLERG